MTKNVKEFITLFGPLSLALLVGSAWFIQSQNLNHKAMLGERQQALVTMVTQTLECDLHSFATDTQFLAALVGHYVDKGPKPFAQIEESFIDFIQTRNSYFSIRYIDAEGVEQLRVDKNFAGPVVVPEKSLQYKGGRYYHRKAMRAAKNQVYMSNFDLNIERGRLEVPSHPTLRFSARVADSQGILRGVVVVNLEGRLLLDKIRNLASAGESSVMLCNSEGFWMIGEKEEYEWNHLLNDQDHSSMASLYPNAWRTIVKTDQSQLVTRNGLFTSKTITIMPNDYISGGLPFDVTKGWKLITRIPKEALRVTWLQFYFIMVFLALLFSGAVCWQIARNRVKQLEVEGYLRDNEELISIISHSAQDAIFMAGAHGDVTHWNLAAQKMLGYGPKEVLGKPLGEILAFEKLQDEIEDVMSGCKLESCNALVEIDVPRKDQSRVPVELAMASFQFKGDWYVVGWMRDVTKRRHAQRELQRSEQTSRALINASTDGAMLLEADGTIVALNDVGSGFLHAYGENLIGENIFSRLSGDLGERGKAYLSKVVKTGQGEAYEDIIDDRRMQVNCHPVKDPYGKVELVALFARDVTEQHEAEAALLRSRQRFRDVSQAVGEFIWETDADGRFVFVTDDVFVTLGYTPEELIGTKSLNLLLAEDIEMFTQWQSKYKEKRESFSNLEVRVLSKDGRLIWGMLSGVPYYDESGSFMGYRGAAMNITDRKASENAVKASEQKFRALADSAYDSIVMVDAVGRILFWNNAAETLFGYTEEVAKGRNLHRLIIPTGNRSQTEMELYQFAITGTGPMLGVSEIMAQDKNGRQFPLERSVSEFRLAEDWYAVITMRDITERQATEAKLRELATTDSLTGLFNRRRFLELAEQEFSRSMRYGRALAVFILDIDHFKKVNDTYGHDVGDQVLRALSQVANQALRNEDVFGRLGGEEFGILLPETGEEVAFDVAERLRQSIEDAVVATTAGDIHITVSIGVSILTEDIGTIQFLLKQADVALYRAKQAGRNCIIKGNLIPSDSE